MLKFFAEKMWVAFALQKLLTFFQQKKKKKKKKKKIRILYTESAKTVNEMTLNEPVKLTTLWITGPWKGATLKWKTKIPESTFFLFIVDPIPEVKQNGIIA